MVRRPEHPARIPAKYSGFVRKPALPSSAGGWRSIWYTIAAARRVGGVRRMIAALRSRNACKTCALGMGGQQGGMRNEAGRFPEVCKKSVQAMAADMAGRLRHGFFDEFPHERLMRLTPRELEAAGRIVEPHFAAPGDDRYRPISWDEALDRIGRRMRECDPDRTFFYFSGRSSNEAAFLLQLVARLYGTNHVNNCSFFCHQASGVALTSVLGSGTATVSLEDLDPCDFAMVLGANPASNHPRLMRTLMEIRRRRGCVIVVNPLREVGLVRFKVPSDVRSLLVGSEIASHYIQPHIGGDIAFMYGVAKGLLARGAVDHAFIARATEGWEALRGEIESMAWESIERSSGVARGEIERVADAYARAKAAIFCWTMGMTHHRHGVDNVRMIANLALMRGMVGRPNAGLLPLRGHSNVQGVGSMGATPALKKQVMEALERRLGVQLPTSEGMDTLACVRRAAEGGVDFAMHLGGNLFGSCPDADAARAALGRIGMTVFLSTTLNTGHAHGRGRESLILPVRARDEESQPTTQESMFNFVRLSDGGPPRHEGPRSEVSVIASIARRAIGNAAVDFESLERHADLRRLIAEVIPGYEPIGEIDRTRREFHVGGRILHSERFSTPSGRARFHAVRPPSPVRGDDPASFALMTLRSEGQFNTVVYEEEDIYRGQERRDVILMHPDDMKRLGLEADDRVRVASDAGEWDGVLVRPFDIRPGNAAMYYPEANVLVPQETDPESRTPAFKSVRVRVTPSRRLPVVSGVATGGPSPTRAAARPRAE